MSRRFPYILFISCFFLFSCSRPAPTETSENFLEKAARDSEQSERFYREAIRAYEQVLKTSPETQVVLEKLGSLYYGRADYEKAAEYFSRLQDESARRRLAICYYKSGKNTEALAVFNQVGESGDDEYLYYYGLCCEQHHLYDQALKIYNKIQTSFKSKAEARVKAINALAEATDLKSLDLKVQEMIQKAPGQEAFPQANAIVLSVDEKAEVKADNTIVYEYYYLTKILNDRGKNYGEIELHYDSTYETIEIEFARVIRPDGQVISVGAKHIRDVSLYTNFPLYSNARVKIISMPEISPGCVIEYKVKQTRSKMIADNQFSIEYFLQSFDPIQRAKFTVVMPQGRALHQKILNEEFNTTGAGLKAKMASQSGQDIYTWEFKDIPQIIPESQMPPTVEITPIVLLSTFQSWDEIYTWWRGLAIDKIQVNDEIKQKIKALIQDLKTPEDKIRAIYNFCARDIRYVAIEYGQAGHEPHKAVEIFNNKYGDCKDKAILLIAMLKEINVKAYPVLIGTKGVIAVSEDFPTLIFNHCIAVAEVDGKRVFFDPTGETVLYGDLPEGDQNRNVFVFFDDKGQLVMTPWFEAAHNTVEMRTVMNFKDDESIEGSREVLTSGVYDQAQRWRFRYTIPILLEDELKNAIRQNMPVGKLKSYKIENLDDVANNIILFYDFSGSNFLIKAGKDKRVVPSLASWSSVQAGRDSRQYSIDFDTPQVERKIIEFNLANQYRVLSLPEAIIQDSPWFRYESRYLQEENKVVFTEEKMSKGQPVNPKDYPLFKAMTEKLSSDVKQCLILERTGK